MIQFTISTKIPASPETLYTSWLHSDSHAAMTGVNARISDKEGDSFSVYSDYIRGKNIELIPNKRIVQKWRTTEFNDADEDSNVVITLTPVGDETLLTLFHSHIPDGSTDYAAVWEDYYFVPMRVYFSRLCRS